MAKTTKKMYKYWIMETTHVNAYREPEMIYATCDADAKRKASRNQVFIGTVLKIYTHRPGIGDPCAYYKEDENGWVKSDEYPVYDYLEDYWKR